MLYHEKLAARVREIIRKTGEKVEEKKMFGGLCFMVNDKMCAGVETERLMIRFDPAITATLMEMEGVRPMDFTNKVMKGFAFIDIAALKSGKQLEYFIGLALDYNRVAKPSKKRK